MSLHAPGVQQKHLLINSFSGTTCLSWLEIYICSAQERTIATTPPNPHGAMSEAPRRSGSGELYSEGIPFATTQASYKYTLI